MKILKINYFGNGQASVLYCARNKTVHCRIEIDYFNNRIFFPKPQPKECKVYKGIESLISNQIFVKTK